MASEQEFLETITRYDALLRRVCFMYSSNTSPFADLYQEVMVNLWRGFDSFRNESAISTWIYRTAFNTCISWHRRNRRHQDHRWLDEAMDNIVAPDDQEHRNRLRLMYSLIDALDPLEKAIVMMWLDKEPYEAIAAVTGLTPGAIGVRLNRIKTKLKNLSENL